jgi:hypothetical protein
MSMTKDKIDRSKLPDRWDFDKWRSGKPLNPPRGPKVSIYWGVLLTLEYFLRQAGQNLSHVEDDIKRLHDHINALTPPEPDDQASMSDDPSLAFARDTVRNVEFILGELRRSQKWPERDHLDWPPQQVIFCPGPVPSVSQPSQEGDLDDDIPF